MSMVKPLTSILVIVASLAIMSTAIAQSDRDCADFTYQQDVQSYFVSIAGATPSDSPHSRSAWHRDQALSTRMSCRSGIILRILRAEEHGKVIRPALRLVD